MSVERRKFLEGTVTTFEVISINKERLDRFFKPETIIERQIIVLSSECIKSLVFVKQLFSILYQPMFPLHFVVRSKHRSNNAV